MTPPRVLVIGPPRSGTSCVAGVLHRLGVSMGTRFPPADEMNPTGYYVDLDFEEVMAGWFDIDRFPEPTGPLPAGAHAAAAKVIAARDAGGGRWGVKGTFASALLAPMLATGGVLAVLTARDKDASEASLAAHTAHPRADIQRLLDWSDAAATHVAASVPTLRVNFETLLASPAAEVARIAAFVRRAVMPDAVSFVTPSLRRF